LLSDEDRKALDRWCGFPDDPSQILTTSRGEPIPGIDATTFPTDKATVRLRTRDDLVFLSNADPLAKRTADVWPYRALVERLRPGLLRRLRQAISPQSVVAGHGKKMGWPLHKEAFLRGTEPPEQHRDPEIEVYRTPRLILGERNSA